MRAHKFFQEQIHLFLEYEYPSRMQENALKSFINEKAATFGFSGGALSKLADTTNHVFFRKLKLREKTIIITPFKHINKKPLQTDKNDLFRAAEQIELKIKEFERTLGEFYIFYQFFRELEKNHKL